MTKVVNCKKEKCQVYIGRPGKWGNPFIIGIHGSREDVIDMYRKWIVNQKHLISSLYELKDKKLGCWCKPASCHGDVLVEMVNNLKDE